MIQIENLSHHYNSPSGKVLSLDNISLNIVSGEIFGIVGRSGAGKSTLIRTLNLLEKPTKGKMLVAGSNVATLSKIQLRNLRQKIGMVFQHFNLLRSRSVIDNVRLPLRIAGDSHASQIEKAQKMLKLVGLDSFAHRYPKQLSGGQQQRVGIARALANEPNILLCDEATSALDPETTQSILSLLQNINESLKITIILITHSMDVIRAICDKVAVLDAGKVVEQGKVLDVFLHPKHQVTRALLSENCSDVEAWRTIANNVKGKIMRLSFRGVEATVAPALSHISRELKLNLSILQGTIGQIKNTPYGQLVISAQGSKKELEQLPVWLDNHSINCEVLREAIGELET